MHILGNVEQKLFYNIMFAYEVVIAIDVNKQEPSAQSNVGWRVDPRLRVSLSHCKTQLRFERSLVLQGRGEQIVKDP